MTPQLKGVQIVVIIPFLPLDVLQSDLGAQEVVAEGEVNGKVHWLTPYLFVYTFVQTPGPCRKRGVSENLVPAAKKASTALDCRHS